jgi:hypothetical protein
MGVELGIIETVGKALGSIVIRSAGWRSAGWLGKGIGQDEIARRGAG